MTPNPLFNKQFTPYEQYIMFIGYLDRIHYEMANKSHGNEKAHEFDHMVMGVLNKKVTEMLFPDGDCTKEMIENIGDQMGKLKMSDRIDEILDHIKHVLGKYDRLDKLDGKQLKSVMKELWG